MAANIRLIVAEKIRNARKPLTVTKVKLAVEGGKHTMTIGRYKTAVPDQNKRYAIFCYGRNVLPHRREMFFRSAADAAVWLIDFCGGQRLRQELNL
ncbi:hypothetical protein [Azospirillum argentinense]|uniref:Uncharacterized protein n=1 Tax=Azospirillum brasilense TaxID=192 RepID=A0A4D8QGF9_AZOBR|nr:hypothetical protein [Azospirillum argentinense]QCO07300.1 hypothetical protein D3867_36070 [Azospirillum argentinense]